MKKIITLLLVLSLLGGCCKKTAPANPLEPQETANSENYATGKKVLGAVIFIGAVGAIALGEYYWWKMVFDD